MKSQMKIVPHPPVYKSILGHDFYLNVCIIAAERLQVKHFFADSALTEHPIVSIVLFFYTITARS